MPNAADCSDCHGNDATTVTGQGVIATGKHTAHINNADPELGTFDCGRCHADTVTTGDNKTVTGARHADLSEDVYYDSLNSGATANTCNTVYCHSDGKGGYNDQDLTTEWGGATTLDCTGCHGDNGSSNFGEPDYASGAAGAADANSHDAHVSVAADCGSCHTSTSTTGTDITGALHINNAINVTIAAAYDSDADPANNYDQTLNVTVTDWGRTRRLSGAEHPLDVTSVMTICRQQGHMQRTYRRRQLPMEARR
jgi:predicted CxxxxCH...CXXCH cytochrome family protein